MENEKKKKKTPAYSKTPNNMIYEMLNNVIYFVFVLFSTKASEIEIFIGNRINMTILSDRYLYDNYTFIDSEYMAQHCSQTRQHKLRIILHTHGSGNNFFFVVESIQSLLKYTTFLL